MIDLEEENEKRKLEYELLKKMTEEALERRNNMMLAVNEMSIELLSCTNETFGEVMGEGLKPVSAMAGIDRVAVYRRLDGEKAQFGQVYLWYGGTIELEKELAVLPDILPVIKWLEILTKGECINADTNGMPDEEAAFLRLFGVKSIYMVPVFTQGKFWGVITLEDHTEHRYFPQECLDMLKSAAHLCAGAVIRAEIERRAAEARELSNAIKEASPLSYVLFDENMKPLDCNNAFMRLLGCSDKQYILDNYWEFAPETQPDSRNSQDKAQAMKDLAFSAGRSSFEWVHKSVSGELIITDNTLSQVIYKGKRLIIAFKYDLRSTKKMTEDIKEQGEKLKEALHKANDASRAKSEFLSNMSHEMRTPMNAIIGMTTIGRKAEDIEQKNHALNKIGDASSHLLAVINDVLDMSKIEAGKLELAPIEYNFERMLQNVLSVINFRVDEKQQQLSVSVGSDIPRFVVGDDQRLAQVITNLLSNAVKFTPEGGEVMLEAVLTGEKDGVCEVRVTIADSGIGISMEQQAKLFNAFGQAESGTSRLYGGTGLGLVISKRIIELMNGRIWIESELGRGAKFMFTVQVRRSHKNQRALLAPEVNWKNVRILAADDMPETRIQFQELFAALDIKCDVARDGVEAVEIIKERGEYDIYFIDWRMPRMDGIELTRWIKSHKTGRPSVVTMITALDWAIIKDEAFGAGVNKCLLKPLLSSMIIDCVNECLCANHDEEAPEIESGEFAGKRLLLAEDIEINREIVISLLESTGIKIDCAENGREALEIIKAFPDKYDIMVMDVQMPEMDGLEAARRIRALPERGRGRLPIIAMTANVFKDDIAACLEAGMDGDMGKPLDIDRLMEILRRYLRKI